MQKKLKKYLKQWKKDKTIFDIVIYGSFVMGKENPNDIDVAVIFNSGTLKERLVKLQDIKRNIKLDIKLDIKSVLLEELFKEEFFGRTGIFFEGQSIFDEISFSKKIGFESFSMFTYNLRNKNHNEKVKFNYILSGRNNIGLIKKLKGRQISPGVIYMPIFSSCRFEEILILHKIDYIKKEVLVKI